MPTRVSPLLMETRILVQTLRWKELEWCVLHRRDRTRRGGWHWERWKQTQTEEQIAGEGMNVKETPWEPPNLLHHQAHKLCTWGCMTELLFLLQRPSMLFCVPGVMWQGSGHIPVWPSRSPSWQHTVLTNRGFVQQLEEFPFTPNSLYPLQFLQQEKCLQSLDFHILSSKWFPLKRSQGTLMLKETERLERWLRQWSAVAQAWGPEPMGKIRCGLTWLWI